MLIWRCKAAAITQTCMPASTMPASLPWSQVQHGGTDDSIELYAVLRPLPWECNTLNQFWGGQVSSCNCLLHKWLMPPLSKTSEPEQKATHGFSKWCTEKRISNKDSKHISQRKTCISYFLYTLWDCSQIRLHLNRSLEVLLWHSLVMYAGCPSLCQKQWTF